MKGVLIVRELILRGGGTEILYDIAFALVCF